MDRLSLDTTVLIDLQRERSRPQEDRPAHYVLSRHGDVSLELCPIVLGEYGEGFVLQKIEEAISPIVQSCKIAPIDVEVTLVYARLARDLRKRGILIGGNDLWIAATCLRYELPLVSRDREQFNRVQGLAVFGY